MFIRNAVLDYEKRLNEKEKDNASSKISFK
jgi:hypothetical protein